MANIRTPLEELYQQENERGVIKVGGDNYITYSPQIE